MWKRIAVATCLAILAAGALSAQEELNENERTLLTVVEPLQRAVASGDRAAVAELLIYPIDVWNGRARVTMRDEAEFMKIYDRVVDFRLKRTIARADVRKAFSNYQGWMFDRGRIWIGMRGEDLGVITINAPTMFEYGESVPYDAEDTLQFPDLVGEYVGESGDGTREFLFTGKSGNARVSLPAAVNEAKFSIGTKTFVLRLARGGGDRLILTIAQPSKKKRS